MGVAIEEGRSGSKGKLCLQGGLKWDLKERKETRGDKEEKNPS